MGSRVGDFGCAAWDQPFASEVECKMAWWRQSDMLQGRFPKSQSRMLTRGH